MMDVGLISSRVQLIDWIAARKGEFTVGSLGQWAVEEGLQAEEQPGLALKSPSLTEYGELKSTVIK